MRNTTTTMPIKKEKTGPDDASTWRICSLFYMSASVAPAKQLSAERKVVVLDNRETPPLAEGTTGMADSTILFCSVLTSDAAVVRGWEGDRPGVEV